MKVLAAVFTLVSLSVVGLWWNMCSWCVCVCVCALKVLIAMTCLYFFFNYLNCMFFFINSVYKDCLNNFTCIFPSVCIKSKENLCYWTDVCYVYLGVGYEWLFLYRHTCSLWQVCDRRKKKIQPSVQKVNWKCFRNYDFNYINDEILHQC